jgi:hypothetical protein
MLFSPSMVSSNRSGRKTNTRRLFKGIEDLPNGLFHIFGGMVGVAEEDVPIYAPEYLSIQPGDRIWVRETWRTESNHYDDLAPSEMGGEETILYDADTDWRDNKTVGKTRVSIHMPRWASRTTLLVHAVRVERLLSISREDAIAEGLEWVAPTYGVRGIASTWNGDPRKSYFALWDHINGHGAAAKNPWVSVYHYEVVDQNIDQIARAA